MKVLFAVFLAVVVAAIGGWIANIVKLFGYPTLDGEAILRIIGVFAAPLGAILGYM